MIADVEIDETWLQPSSLSTHPATTTSVFAMIRYVVRSSTKGRRERQRLRVDVSLRDVREFRALVG